MNFKINDKVIFIGNNDKYTWKLTKFKIYTITNRAFYKYSDKIQYAVKNDNCASCWYDETDFINLKEFRKLKLNNICIK